MTTLVKLARSVMKSIHVAIIAKVCPVAMMPLLMAGNCMPI